MMGEPTIHATVKDGFNKIIGKYRNEPSHQNLPLSASTIYVMFADLFTSK